MTPLDAHESNSREGGASFSLGHRLLRLAWSIVWTTLGRWTPVPLHGWRRMLLRMFGARIHPTAVIYPSARVWYPPNLVMDRYACIAGGVNVYCMHEIHFAEYALASQGAYLCGGTHDIDDPSFQLITKPIRLGENAWVAAEAFVGPGVTVGDGAVLGARGVTFKNLEPMMVYAGNPARPIRRRNLPGDLK